MKKAKGNILLLNKARFVPLLRDKNKYLKSLTIKKSAKILEELTASDALSGLRITGTRHSPLCLKYGLKKRKV